MSFCFQNPAGTTMTFLRLQSRLHRPRQQDIWEGAAAAASIRLRFSKTELIKKPFQAKRKLLSGILNCVDAAIEKTEQLAADVKKYQTDKAERETGSIGSMEAVNPVELAIAAEPEFQYGAEAFEAHQQETAKAMTTDKTTKNMPVKNGKSR